MKGTNSPCIFNAMTIDVEDYFHVQAFADNIDRSSWETRESRVVDNTRRLLNLFGEYSVRATFFVLGWVAERKPELIKEIHANGHEIACHGYSHQLVYKQTPLEFSDETKRAKKLLEDIIGTKVVGYRAASYSIVRDTLWALDILIENGFEYDSSIFPVYHDKYGIPDARREPHQIKTPGGGTIVEWPLSTAKVLGYHLPVGGGGYFRLLPYWVTQAGLSSINMREKAPFIFYLHPWEVDPDQPRIQSSWLSRFRHYTNIGQCESRLHRLLQQYKFSTVLEGLSVLNLLPRKHESC